MLVVAFTTEKQFLQFWQTKSKIIAHTSGVLCQETEFTTGVSVPHLATECWIPSLKQKMTYKLFRFANYFQLWEAANVCICTASPASVHHPTGTSISVNLLFITCKHLLVFFHFLLKYLYDLKPCIYFLVMFWL